MLLLASPLACKRSVPTCLVGGRGHFKGVFQVHRFRHVLYLKAVIRTRK